MQPGKQIATKDRTFVCGALGGFIETVCKVTKLSPDTLNGQTVEILTDNKIQDTNPYIDTAIVTDEGIKRNTIIVHNSDNIIASGNDAWTLSETAFACQFEKKVLCVTLFEGWAKELAGKNLDERKTDQLIPVSLNDEISPLLNQLQC